MVVKTQIPKCFAKVIFYDKAFSRLMEEKVINLELFTKMSLVRDSYRRDCAFWLKKAYTRP